MGKEAILYGPGPPLGVSKCDNKLLLRVISTIWILVDMFFIGSDNHENTVVKSGICYVV